MPSLTREQVLALAPDPASAKAGSALATPRKWSNTGRDAESRMVWGECAGSGANPYRTQADLSEPAFRCTCPSRKFPCKHSLALLLLLATDDSQFATTQWPEWVAEWVSSRQDRAERRAAKQESDGEERAVDPAARAKRVAARADKITGGLAELDLWMRDLVRGGIAGVEARPGLFFHSLAARLVDAQAPGAARLVRELAFLPTTGDGWHERMVARLGRLHLLTAAWSRYETLSPEAQADVRAHLGWSITESELSDAPGVDDQWIVVGQIQEDDDRLRVRRTWLLGAASSRLALLLHFAVGTAPFTELLPSLGNSFRAELAFFPGSLAQRAFIRSRSEEPPQTVAWPSGQRLLSVAVSAFARALSLDPWVERVPLLLDVVVPERIGNGWRVRDERGDVLPITPRFRGWSLLAVSGAHPVSMSAEWTGEHLVPLAVASGETLLSLTAA